MTRRPVLILALYGVLVFCCKLTRAMEASIMEGMEGREGRLQRPATSGALMKEADLTGTTRSSDREGGQQKDEDSVANDCPIVSLTCLVLSQQCNVVTERFVQLSPYHVNENCTTNSKSMRKITTRVQCLESTFVAMDKRLVAVSVLKKSDSTKL